MRSLNLDDWEPESIKVKLKRVGQFTKGIINLNIWKEILEVERKFVHIQLYYLGNEGAW